MQKEVKEGTRRKNMLARRRGFESHSDYRKARLKERGFDTYYQYQNYLARKKGFESFCDETRSKKTSEHI